MGIKERLKHVQWLRKSVKRAKTLKEYLSDAHFMNEHFLDAGNSTEHETFRIMLLVHSIEKGLSSRSPRPFGAAKCVKLASLLEAASADTRNSTSYTMGMSVLGEWVTFHLAHGWQETLSFAEIREFVGQNQTSGAKSFPSAGTLSINGRQPDNWSNLPFAEFLRSRHSTRRYNGATVEDEVVTECVALALLSPSACNRQMVRFHVVDDPAPKELLYRTLHGTGGVDFETCRLGLVTFDVNGLEFYGERNQGYLNAGLFAMTLVQALHWKGVGSCLLQFGNTFAAERMLVRELGLPSTERIAVGISFGVMESEDTVPASARRQLQEVMPTWRFSENLNLSE